MAGQSFGVRNVSATIQAALLTAPQFTQRDYVLGLHGFHGVGELIEVEQTLTASTTLICFKKVFLSPSKIFLGTDENIPKDNAPCHSSRYPDLDWTSKLPNLSWPSNSPDMNIIETVWGHMEENPKDPPLTVTELRHNVHRIWNSLPAEYLQSLHAQIQTSVQTLIDKRGYPTKF